MESDDILDQQDESAEELALRKYKQGNRKLLLFGFSALLLMSGSLTLGNIQQFSSVFGAIFSMVYGALLVSALLTKPAALLAWIFTSFTPYYLRFFRFWAWTAIVVGGLFTTLGILLM